jgi:hypothetical protein
MLSLVAILGGMEKIAIQRVLVSLGSALLDVRTPMFVDRELASRLLVQIAKESGESAAIDVADDMHFVARSWKPILEDTLLRPDNPHRALPYAEIIFALVNYSGHALSEYRAFEQFGGADLLLPMPQLTAALRSYPVPRPDLTWNLVGFQDPGDHALVGQDEESYYLFKFAPTPTTLRLSELERGSDEDSRHDHDIHLDPALFAAFVAGLLGDMLYWAARLRNHVLPGHQMWERIQNLLHPAQPAEREPRAPIISTSAPLVPPATGPLDPNKVK